MPRRKVGSIEWLGGDACRIRVQRGERVANRTLHGLTQAEAEARAVQMAQELGRTDAYDASMTLSAYYWGIFREKPSNRGTPRAKTTLDWYDGCMRRDVLPRLGDMPLSAITHVDMRLCVQSARSPTNAKRALQAVMRSAYDDELVPERPMDRRIPTHRRRRPQEEPWTRFEAAQALRAAREAPADIECYLILGLSGLGREEAMGVTPADVREQSTYSIATGEELRTMTVTVSRVYTDADGLREGAKNEFRARTVPVLAAGRERLLARLSEGREAAREAGALDEWARARLVPFTAGYLYRRWRDWLSRAGLRYIPPNMLRHTSDTLMLTAGVVADLNDRMHGRVTHASTYGSYFRPDLGLMEQASRQVSDVL